MSEAGSVEFILEANVEKLRQDLENAKRNIYKFAGEAEKKLKFTPSVEFNFKNFKTIPDITPKINQKNIAEESAKAKKIIENSLNSVNITTKLGKITMGSDLRGITKEIMAGLAIGLSGAGGVGGTVGKGLIAGMKTALGIHSPSTEAIAVMQQVIAGLQVGLKQGNLTTLFNPITLALQAVGKGSPFNQILFGFTNLLGLTAHANRETTSLVALFTSIDPNIKLARTVGTLKILAQLGNSMIGVFNLGLTNPFQMANEVLVTGLLPNMQTILALMGVVNRYTSQGLISPARLADPVKALDILYKSLDAVGKQAPITFGLLGAGINYAKLTHSISNVQLAYGLLRQELIGLQQELQQVGRMAIESAGSLAIGGGFGGSGTNAFQMFEIEEGVKNLSKFRFDTSQFTKLNYLLGESKESVESVTQSFLKNSDDLLLPFDKLVEGLNAMTREGMSLNEIKSSFNEIANSATVSGIEIDKLVPAVVSVSQAFNQIDMGKLSSQLATASAIGGLGVDDLSKGLLKLSPIINATGSDITDMMALLAGMNNSTGRSQPDITRSIQLMNMNLAGARGAKATPLLQQLGISPTDIRQATGELKPISDVISVLREKVQAYQATGRSAVPIAQAIFGSGPVGTTIQQMIGVGENSDLMASEVAKARAIITDGSASVNSALQKDSETLNASLQKLANATQAISISVGKFFEPFLLIITNTALGVAQFFNGIDSSAKAFALTLKITIPLALLYYKSILSFVYAQKMAVASGELVNVMMTKQNVISALGTEIIKIKAMTMAGLSTAWSILTGKMTLAEIAQGAWNLSAKIGAANIAEFSSTTGKANAIIGGHLKALAKMGVTIGLLIIAWKVWASLFQRSEGYERAKSYEALNSELEKLRKNLYPEDRGTWDKLIDKANSFKSIIVSLLDDMKKVGAVEVLRNQLVGGFGTTSEQQNKTDPYGSQSWLVSGQQAGNQQAIIALGQVMDTEVNPAFQHGIDLLARYNVSTLEQARSVKLSAGSLANFKEQAKAQIGLQQGIIDKLKATKTATEAEETTKQAAIRSAQSQINVIRAVIASQSAETQAIQEVAMSLDDLLKKYEQLNKERMLVALQNKAKFEEGLVGGVSTTQITVSMDEISRDRALQGIEQLKGNIESAKAEMAELSVFMTSSSGEELAKAQDEFDRVLKQSYQDRIQLAQELYKYELDLALENIKQIELARKNSLKQLTNNNELESADTDRKTSLQSITAEVSLMPLEKAKQELEYKLQLAEINENDKAVEELKSQIYSQNLIIAQAKSGYDAEALELQIESRNIALDTAKINTEIAMAESQANLARAFANKESREVIESLQIELSHRQKLIASAQANIANNNKIAELERRKLALSGEYTIEGMKQSREVEKLREAKENSQKLLAITAKNSADTEQAYADGQMNLGDYNDKILDLEAERLKGLKSSLEDELNIRKVISEQIAEQIAKQRQELERELEISTTKKQINVAQGILTGTISQDQEAMEQARIAKENDQGLLAIINKNIADVQEAYANGQMNLGDYNDKILALESERLRAIKAGLEDEINIRRAMDNEILANMDKRVQAQQHLFKMEMMQLAEKSKQTDLASTSPKSDLADQIEKNKIALIESGQAIDQMKLKLSEMQKLSPSPENTQKILDLERELNEAVLGKRITLLDQQLAIKNKIKSATELEAIALDNQAKIMDDLSKLESSRSAEIKARANLELKLLEGQKEIANIDLGDSGNYEIGVKLLDQQFAIQQAINKAKSDQVKADLDSNQKALEMDYQREQITLRKTEIENRLAVLRAKDDVMVATQSGDSGAIALAQQQLKISNDSLSVILQQKDISDQNHTIKKNTLNLDNQALLAEGKITQFKEQQAQLQSKLNLAQASATKEIDKQKTKLDAIANLNKAISNARVNALEKQISFQDQALQIQNDLKDENINPYLKDELKGQLNQLTGGNTDEKTLFRQRLEMEQKLADEKMKALAKEHQMQKAMMEIELAKNKIAAAMAVSQAKILAIELAKNGMAEEGKKLVEGALQAQQEMAGLGDMVRESLSYNQASEVYNQEVENYNRQNEQRRKMAEAGYKPNMPRPEMPKFDEPTKGNGYSPNQSGGFGVKDKTIDELMKSGFKGYLPLSTRTTQPGEKFLGNTEPQYKPAEINPNDFAQDATQRAANAVEKFVQTIQKQLEDNMKNIPAPSGPGGPGGPSQATPSQNNQPIPDNAKSSTSNKVSNSEVSNNTTVNNNFGGVTIISSDPTGDARKVIGDLTKAKNMGR